jgi:hypothetical protein
LVSPTIIPSMNAFKEDSFSRPLRRGTRANHAIQPVFPGGKEAVSMTPERTARSIFLVGIKDILITGLNKSNNQTY